MLAANRARLSVDFDFTPMYPEWRMQTFAKDQALDVARLGTDGHSNADLSRPLTDRERQNAVQADPTEKKPEHSGVTQRRTRQLHGHEDVRDHAGHRHLLTVRQIEGRANLFQGLCYGFFYASILGASAILLRARQLGTRLCRIPATWRRPCKIARLARRVATPVLLIDDAPTSGRHC